MGTEASAEWPGTIDEDSRVVQEFIEAIRSVRLGQVQIILQNSRLVQVVYIDKTEKVPLMEQRRIES